MFSCSAVQYEALWALTNIASGTHDHAQLLVHLDVLPHFKSLLASPVHRVREQACWALGNIAGDCSDMRDRVLSLGVMRDTLNLLVDQSSRLSLIRIATWTMSNLCRGKPPPSFSLVREAIGVAAQLIFSTDKEVLVDALWTLSFLSDGKDNKQRAVADANVCPQLVSLLQSNELQFLVPALRTIGNLMSGDDKTTNRVIEAGALNYLAPLLAHARHGVRKEACWTVSNVLAGTTAQIQSAIEAKLIPPILRCLHEDRFDIRKEAAWCIANAVSGAANAQVVYFVQQQCIETLCGLLDLPDTALLDMTLEALERVLKVGSRIQISQRMQENPFKVKIEDCNGVDKIEKCQDHPNEDIYTKAGEILKSYFDVVSDDEDADMAPTADGNQFGFGGGNMPQGGFNFSTFQ
jgi:importin subunit alpha-6/7